MARRQFPDAPEPFLDLSTGINPLAYPMPPLAPEVWTRLPEPEALARLQEVAARAYGAADPAMVVAAPGTQLLISLLPLLWRVPAVTVLGPTYAEHAACWRAAGSVVRDARELPDADAGGVVLCNPNNPDGRRLSVADLLALADRLAARGGLLVVDEAFADLEGPECSVVPRLPHPAVVVLRSFGKTYGLAGVWLGFAVAAPDRAAAIRSALGPWAVSGPAIVVAGAALADAGWRAATRARLDAEVAALDACLTGAGLRVIGGTRLFRLAATTDPGLFERLGRAGILVRRFAERPDWLRFGLPPDTAALARLGRALRPAAGQNVL